VVEMDRNKGFAGGVNAGLEFAGDGRVVIMHNDVIVTNGWAEAMGKVMDSEEDAAAVTCRTNYANEGCVCVPETRKRFEQVKPSNKVRLEPAEVKDVLSKTYPDGIDAEAGRVFSEAKMPSQYSVEIASHCVLVREGMFKKYGTFDEDFFPRGFEDKFWFQALELDGWACFVSNMAYVHHFGNATSDGPGFSFPEVFRINEAKFKEKSESRIKARTKSTPEHQASN
jgi:GT2 family glycosyltransferase